MKRGIQKRNNTGLRKTLPSLTIDPEFAKLTPPLAPAEYKGLRKSLLTHGCLDSLKVWRDILIDGLNRERICRQYNIPFTIVQMHFRNRDEAKAEIVKNQLSRRNVTDFTRCLLALELEELEAKKAKERQAAGGKQKVPQISAEAENGDTRDKIAEIAGVSHDTIAKVKLIKEKGTAKEIEELSRPDSKITINKVYHRIRWEQQRTETPPFPDRKFSLIYADPPWQFEFVESENRSVQNHYPTMSFEELAALPVSCIAEDDSVIVMWCPACMLDEAMRLMKTWGFAYHTGGVWIKECDGMGYWLRNRHELWLLGTKGKPPAPPD
jgi:16S rRNA G966 N2-methylase RsmD